MLQYLLQGSLILLLLADKLSTETNDGVIRACEIIVRAHEAAVVTLNTEYQVRQINQFMHSIIVLNFPPEKLPEGYDFNTSANQGPWSRTRDDTC
jgi:hypothetical protein